MEHKKVMSSQLSTCSYDSDATVAPEPEEDEGMPTGGNEEGFETGETVSSPSLLNSKHTAPVKKSEQNRIM